jgi:hypothetical protein
MFVSPSPAGLTGAAGPLLLLILVFLGLAARLRGSPAPFAPVDICEAGLPLGMRFGGGMAMDACDAVRGIPPRVADGFRDIALMFAIAASRTLSTRAEDRCSGDLFKARDKDRC